MKRHHIHPLGRLCIAIALVSNLFALGLGGIVEVGASSYLPEMSNQNVDSSARSLKNKIYDDKDKAWVFTGNWSESTVSRAYGKQLHVSNTVGDYATISITGSKFTLIFTKAENYGKLDVYVDDIKIHTVKQKKSKTSHQTEWTSPGIGSGSHVIKFVHASGKTVNIDAIKVRVSKPNPDPAPTDNPAITEAPILITPEIPNPIASPFQTEVPILTIVPSPTNSVPVEEPALTLLPDPTSSPTPVEVVAQITTSTPSLVPSPTASSTLSQVPSPTASFTSTTSPTPYQVPSPIASPTPAITSASPINPTPTNTQIPTFTSTSVPTATKTPTSTVNPTATSSSTPSTGLKAYYVSTTGNNTDGRSWGTAWNGLNQVNWSIIQPGDTIYISGGPTSATYAGGIQISKNGMASAYITIDTGANSPSPAGHDGTVIIEGGSQCFLIKGSYVKLRNIVCQHATDDGIRIEGTGTILENNTIRETYGQGIHVSSCKSCVVRGNRITTFPNDGPGENRPYQTDGIVAYESSDTLIERNWIKLTNQYGPAHIDGIQASTQLGANHENITIQYNYVENTKNMTSNSQGIYLTQMEGTIRIIGNVVNHPMGPQSVTSYLANTVGSPANLFVVGNTIKCGGYRCLLVGDDTSPVIKNNIIWQTGAGQLTDLRNVTDCNPADINNNLYYAPNSSYPFAGSCGRTWSEWQNSQHLDATGIFGQNPNLDSCFRPTSGSPSIGKGAILVGEYNQGLSSSLCGPNGPAAFLPVLLQNRNQHGGASWDIGAYELP